MNEERSGRNFIFQKEKEKEKNSNLDRILTIEVVAGRDEYWVEWYLGRVNSFANEVLASLTKRVTLNRRGGVSSHAGGNSIARALLKVTRLTRFLSFRSLGGTRSNSRDSTDCSIAPNGFFYYYRIYTSTIKGDTIDWVENVVPAWNRSNVVSISSETIFFFFFRRVSFSRKFLTKKDRFFLLIDSSTLINSFFFF